MSTNHFLPFEKTRKKILIKKEAIGQVGIDPRERKTADIISYGVVNINKPQGPTSHQVSEYVQRILNLKKAGHSGTLDPNVHGVLPVAIGNATKVVQTLLSSGKEYIGIMHVHKEISKEDVQQTINKYFLGKISQLPPIKSAVKREQRTREIYYFDILEQDDKDFLFIVGCQAGTYIRKLLHDLGQKLRIGAHMAELRRTKAGPFNESTLVSLQDLADAYHYFKEESDETELRKIIQPVENAIAHLPKVWVFDDVLSTVSHGAYLHVPGISKLHNSIKPGDMVAVMSLKEELVSLGIAKMNATEMMNQRNGLAVTTDRVFWQQ